MAFVAKESELPRFNLSERRDALCGASLEMRRIEPQSASNAFADRDARRAHDLRERDRAHKGRKPDGLMMSRNCWNGSDHEQHLVALLISNASGNVESIEAVDTVTQGGCTNMARRVYVANEPTPAGYELKFTCGTREALEGALAEHKCRVLDQHTKQGIVTTRYACDATVKNKFVGWVKSVF